jgi:regulatory protein
MDLLARREHSRRELGHKLRRRYDADEVETALITLAEENLQSDERFAMVFARERMLRGMGPQRIQRELLERGVSGAIADAALRDLQEEEGVHWPQIARAALEKKFGDADLPAAFEERARRLRFLQYRGFSEDDISSADS